MALTEAQERAAFGGGRIRELLEGKSYAEVEEIRRGFAARARLRELGLEDRLTEQETADQFDRFMGIAEEPAPTRTYSASEEGQLQREFDTYLGVTPPSPTAGLPVHRAFSAEDPDGDTDGERALGDAFDRYLGV